MSDAKEDKELYRQKRQAQLDEWKAELDRLKAKAMGAKADAQIAINKQIEALEPKLKDARAKLSELSSASGEAWHSLKHGVESAWDSIKSSVSEASDKFRK